MSAHHARGLYIDGDSYLHRMPAHAKLSAVLLLVFAVVATNREAVWAFAAVGTVLLMLAVMARLPVTVVARRLTIAVPFLVFALLLPVVAGGPRTHLGPVSVSTEGLWGAWNIVAKGTLGMGASLLLVSTTTVADLIRGLDRLRVPPAITAILTFMVRYVDVAVDDLRRMRIARVSRAHDPRWIWQARAVARTAGVLFVRTYERGERVHVAMQSRGYTGRLPAAAPAATTSQWMVALALPVGASLLAASSWLLGA